jgi:hypothetical protein
MICNDALCSIKAHGHVQKGLAIDDVQLMAIAVVASYLADVQYIKNQFSKVTANTKQSCEGDI